ncbi:MAG: SH3 domain-containing protein, partial [Propionibacteriaceae bacterium]|nr:SH3 domain-containing protein [Propionibacteriaceae bacterium]
MMNRIKRTARGALAAFVVAGLVQSVGSLAWVTSADAASSTMRATTAVNVRSGPGTGYSRIGLLYPGERVQAHSSSNGWTRVTYKGREGYIASAYLAGSLDSSGGSNSGATGEVYTTTALNLRTGPSLKSTIRTTAAKGTKLSLTGSVQGEFSQVTWNGQRLWAATRYLSQSASSGGSDLPTTTQKRRATTALMIRTSPGRDYKSLGDVPRGTILDCTDVVTSGMAQCIWQGNVRWFNNRFLQSVSDTTTPAPGKLPSTTTQYAAANLNIWYAATGSRYSGEIPKGSEVAVTGTVTSGRAQIVYKGAIRWVTARYLSSSAPSSGGGSDNGGSLNRGWSKGLDEANENVKKIVRYIWGNVPEIKTMYGVRPDALADHPSGRAVDIMIPNYKSNKALGDRLAAYFKENHQQWRVHYIIWDQKIWNVNRA